MKENSSNKLIVAFLNVNSVRNRLAFLDVTNRNLDIMLLSETNLIFPSSQFILKRYCVPHSFDRYSKGRELLFYIRDDVTFKFVKLRSDFNIESICVEINSRKRKWFINGI